MSKNEISRLGKGLGALISQGVTTDTTSEKISNFIKIDKIKANPYQPRQNFDEEKLKELSESIKSHGILQPLLVTKDGPIYTLIVGERRLRAAKLAGLKEVPVVIKNVTKLELMELAMLENIQREDLSTIEEANGYNQLIKEFHIPLKDLAAKVGKSSAYISNKIRLLSLSSEVLKALQLNEISEGHARAIVSIESNTLQNHALRVVIKNEMNVRQTEKFVRKIVEADKKSELETQKVIKYILSSNAVKIQKSITEKLNLPARIVPLQEGGKLIIRYKEEKDLQTLIDLLSKT